VNRWALVAPLVAVAAACAFVPAVAPPAGAADPSGAVIEVNPSDLAVGRDVLVEFTGWPETVVTAEICGNSARRGSEDCDQIGSESIRIPPGGREFLRLRVQEPPVGCPCVVRATDARGTIVTTAPIAIDGIADGVDLSSPPAAPPAAALGVSDQVRGARGTLATVVSVFGGPSDRVLTLVLSNRSAAPLAGLRFTGTVGHSDRVGAPFAAALPDVPPGASVTVRVPFTIPFPAVGHYVVSGTVSGLDAPVAVRGTAANDPWAIELVLPIGLIVLAQLSRRRRRPLPVGPQVSTDCSPAVGVGDQSDFQSPSYDATQSSVVVEPTVPDASEFEPV